MKLEPRISVIVAAFNQEKFIGRCLRSIIYQSIPKDNYEIIVINDGSTDRTAYALELFHDAINIITNDENLGLPASLNRGIIKASGEYIVRVDADDYVNSNFLHFLSCFLDSNPDIDAIASDYWLFNDEEEWLERVNCVVQPIACAIMFRKKHLIEIGMYDESFRCHEEHDLRIRFEKKYRISRLQLPLYRYRRHDTNMTNNADLMEHNRLNLIRKHGIENI